MSKPTLREKIVASILQFDEGHTYPEEYYGVANQIIQSVSEYISELIGEDEKIQDFGGKVYTKETRNKLRQEMREKLKEDLNVPTK